MSTEPEARFGEGRGFGRAFFHGSVQALNGFAEEFGKANRKLRQADEIFSSFGRCLADEQNLLATGCPAGLDTLRHFKTGIA
jgi:hypothetical protein